MQVFDDCLIVNIGKGNVFYCIEDSIEGSTFKGWVVSNGNSANLYLVDLFKMNVDADLIQLSPIWDKLDKVVQDQIISHKEIKIETVKERMETARQSRKKVYNFDHLPKMLTCKCGAETKANYYALQRKADDLKVPIEDLFKNYVCQKCCCTKGRGKGKGKKLDVNLPAMLTCSCGVQMKPNYSYLQKKADAKKIPLMDLVKNWKCQVCNPTKGRGRKKKS